MKTYFSHIRVGLLACCLLAFGAVGRADQLSFSGLLGTGPQTIGWGYSITNLTGSYLLPLGLSNSGVLYGSLTDIFDYPVVDPGQAIFQAYSYNAPGGAGNSLGLFEYQVPQDLPDVIQTGTFSLLYQLYDSNPDLNPEALAIGSAGTITTPFEIVRELEIVPEPASVLLLATGMFVFYLLFRRRAPGHRRP
jgi:hypothetical protein